MCDYILNLVIRLFIKIPHFVIHSHTITVTQTDTLYVAVLAIVMCGS